MISLPWRAMFSYSANCLEPSTRFELVTPSLPRTCSTPELRGHCFRAIGAGDGTRTRDLLITNQLLYQLSYASTEPLDFKDTSSPKPSRQTWSLRGGRPKELRVIAEVPNGVQPRTISARWLPYNAPRMQT